MADPTQERWLPVTGYEGYYEVSDHGNVRSLGRMVETHGGHYRWQHGRVLKPGSTAKGHMFVYLCRKSTNKKAYIHRLVLAAFVGPCPDGMECCHWDDDPTNNHLSNLRWATTSANRNDQVRNGLHYWARRTHCSAGHEYVPENTYISKDGARVCRACRRKSHREYERRRRLAR